MSSKPLTDFQGYENAILYDTSYSDYKILCAKIKDSNNIKCIIIHLELIISNNQIDSCSISSIEFADDYNFLFSYQKDNCNYTIFKSEYLFCCGKNDFIYCDRRDNNLNLIDDFYINHPGKISNLTLESNNAYAKLTYSNSNDDECHIYEYYIYPPVCKNNEITITTYQTFQISLSDLFEWKTNSKYYIYFKNILMTFATIKINDTIMHNNEKKLIKDTDYLYIISNDETEIKNSSINFVVLIEETYSEVCQIYLTIEPCYHSCKKCSKSIYNSDSSEHNCIECKENYFPFVDNYSNCFSLNEKEINWFFEAHLEIFQLCHSSCLQCNGPDRNNCLSCLSNDIYYLYKGECLIQCPIGTFQSTNSNYDGNLICEDCYKNCETCNKKGNSIQMNCNSCSYNKIYYNEGCYIIYDEVDKRFYNTENESEITSCYELFGKYIKENTSFCIDEIEDGYYLSNPKTGLLSKSDSNCISYSSDKTNCELCKNNLYPQDGICVEACSSHYYLKDNICLKCHDNCLNCTNGEIFDSNGKLISMECIQCKNELLVQIEGNCFPIIYSETNKINYFPDNELENINLSSLFINESESIYKQSHTNFILITEENKGTTEKCNEACDSCFGEGNSQDTNCFKCSPGYYKTEDSDSNCIIENLIPSNHYKNGTDNIYYKIKNILYKNNIELIYDFISSNKSLSVISNSEIVQIIFISDKIK